MDPNPFGDWVFAHWVDLLVTGFLAAMGILGRRVSRLHDEDHNAIKDRLRALEAVKPVTVEQLDAKFDAFDDRMSDRLTDLKKTQDVILQTMLNNGGR